MALYPDWEAYNESDRSVIELDVRKRWKSVRDRFLRFHREVTQSGASPSKILKFPHYEALQFVLPPRELRPSSGNIDAPAETQDEEEGQDLESGPSTSAAGGGDPMHSPSPQAAPSGGDQLEGEGGEPSSPPPVSGQPLPHSAPASAPVRRPPTAVIPRRRGRGTRDRLLDVEDDTRALLQRVESQDQWDFYAHGLASAFRQLPEAVRWNFVAFCLATATEFRDAPQPLDLVDLLLYMRAYPLFRPRAAPPQNQGPQVSATSTQTDPIYTPTYSHPHPPPAPTSSGRQFLQSFYPYPHPSVPPFPNPTQQPTSTPLDEYPFYLTHE